MVFDPNWGTNLFNTFLGARRAQEEQAQREQEMRTTALRQQQLQSDVTRQAGYDQAESEISFAPPPVQPAAPVGPIVSPPGGRSGLPANVRLDPRLDRPGGAAAAAAAMQQKGQELAGLRGEAQQAYAAPVGSYELAQKLWKAGRHAEALKMKSEADGARARQYEAARALAREEQVRLHNEAQLRETARGHSLTAAAAKRTGDLAERKQSWDESPMSALNPIIQNVGTQVGKDLSGWAFGTNKQSLQDDRQAGDVARDQARFKAAADRQSRQDQTRLKIAENNLKAANERHKATLAQAASITDARLRQKAELAAFRAGQDRDAAVYAHQRAAEELAIKNGDLDPGQVMSGPEVDAGGLFGGSSRTAAPRAPIVPPQASSVAGSARAPVMTRAQKRARLAELDRRAGK